MVQGKNRKMKMKIGKKQENGYRKKNVKDNEKNMKMIIGKSIKTIMRKRY